MARNFNGTTDYLTGTVGALSGMDAGPITIAAIIKLDANTPGSSIVYAGGGDLTGVDLGIYDGLFYLGSQEPSLASASTADGWHLVAANKAAGTATPRWHKYVISSDTWTHTDAGSTMGDGVAVAGGDTLQIGRWGNASTRFVGSIAIVGIWDRVLADSEIELLPFSLQAWYTTSPKACLLLDQATATTNIVDLTGGGANITGGTGTTVSTDSVSLFSYGFDVDIPHTAPAASATSASAENASATGTGNNTTTSVAPTSGSAAATGSAVTPSAAIAPPAGAASVAASALNATVQTSTAAVPASTSAAANAPAVSVAPTSAAATSTAAANGPTATVSTTTGTASATAAANDATVTTAAAANAAAALAAAAAVVNSASVSLLVRAGVVAAAATAGDVTAGGQDIATTYRVGPPHGRWHVGRPHGRWHIGRPKGD